MTLAVSPSASHARTMDRLYGGQRHIYDLTRKYYLFGRDRLIAELDPPGGARVLEMGCGTGRNLVVAARLYPQANFYGIDISRQMLMSAEAAARRAGVADRVATLPGDAESSDARAAFGVAAFDRVFFSFSLSMVPNWRRALALALDQLSDDGSLHIVDFGRMARWPALARAAMRAWLTCFHVTPRAVLIGEAEALARARGFDLTTTEIAGGYACLLVLSRSAHRRERTVP